MGTIADLLNTAMRDFVRFTGDGLPGEPIGRPLPQGDPASGQHNPPKKQVREALLAIAGAADNLTEAVEAAAGSATVSGESANTSTAQATISTTQAGVAATKASQAQLAAIAAGAPLVTSLTDPVPANGSIELLQTGAGTQVHEVQAGSWGQIGWLGIPVFPTIAAMGEASGFIDRQRITVESGENGESEDFFVRLTGPQATLPADGALIVDAVGMGDDPATRGRLVSTRTVYADATELVSDRRTFKSGTTLTVSQGDAVIQALASGGTFSNAGEQGLIVISGPRFDARNAANAAECARYPSQTKCRMAGLKYYSDSTKTGSNSVTSDLGVDGLKPPKIARLAHYGPLGSVNTQRALDNSKVVDATGETITLTTQTITHNGATFTNTCLKANLDNELIGGDWVVPENRVGINAWTGADNVKIHGGAWRDNGLSDSTEVHFVGFSGGNNGRVYSTTFTNGDDRAVLIAWDTTYTTGSIATVAERELYGSRNCRVYDCDFLGTVEGASVEATCCIGARVTDNRFKSAATHGVRDNGAKGSIITGNQFGDGILGTPVYLMGAGDGTAVQCPCVGATVSGNYSEANNLFVRVGQESTDHVIFGNVAYPVTPATDGRFIQFDLSGAGTLFGAKRIKVFGNISKGFPRFASSQRLVGKVTLEDFDLFDNVAEGVNTSFFTAQGTKDGDLRSNIVSGTGVLIDDNGVSGNVTDVGVYGNRTYGLSKQIDVASAVANNVRGTHRPSKIKVSIVGASNAAFVGSDEGLSVETGDRIQFTGGTLPSPLVADTNYWAVRSLTDGFALASSLSNAVAGTTISISGDSSGTVYARNYSRIGNIAA